MSELAAHHVGITVPDLERALEFYVEELGLEVVDRFSVSGAAFSEAVDVDGATGTFAHLAADGVRVELVEYDPEGSRRDDADLNQPGAIHLGLSAGDVDAFVDGLSDDVDALSDPQTTESGTSIVFVRDPFGNLIEVIEAGS